MQFLDLLFDNDYDKKTFSYSHGNSGIIITISCSQLIGGVIFRLANTLKKLKTIDGDKDLYLDFSCRYINDDSTIGVLEMLCYDWLASFPGNSVTINFASIDKRPFGCRFLSNSLFAQCSQYKREKDNLLNHPFVLTKNTFSSLFDKQNFIEGPYFRKALFRPITDDQEYSLFEEIDTFLQISQAKKEWIDILDEVIIEIEDNAISHTKGDVISQFKILDNVVEKSTQQNVIVLDASIINLSSETIDSTLSSSVRSDHSEESRKEMVKEAYKNHKQYFGSKYDESAFYMVSAFQNGVSCRPLKNGCSGGGQGLTKLLNALQKDAYYEHCYSMSGNNVLYFVKGHLDMNEDGTIGFNESNNYRNQPPQSPYLEKLPYFFHGSIFNLLFILKR